MGLVHPGDAPRRPEADDEQQPKRAKPNPKPLAKLMRGIRGREEEVGGAKHQCSGGCQRFFLANSILIDQEDSSYDWQGGLHLMCFSCLQGEELPPEAEDVLAGPVAPAAPGPGAPAAPAAGTPAAASAGKSGACPATPAAGKAAGKAVGKAVGKAAAGKGKHQARPATPPPGALIRRYLADPSEEKPRYSGTLEACLRKFRLAVEAKWKDKQYKDGRNKERARISTFKQFMADVARDYPDLSNQQRRKKVCEMCVRLALVVVQAFTNEAYTAAEQELLAQALDTWVGTYDHRVLDPEWVPQLQGLFLPDDVAQYLSEITRGVDEFYICRHLDCGYVGRNTDWACNGTQYACPECARQYRPWLDTAMRTLAQKILIVGKPKTAVPGLVPMLRVGAVAGTNFKDTAADVLLGGDFEMMLCEWPDTATTSLQNTMKEITAKIVEEFKTRPVEDIEQDIIQLVKSTTRPYFQTRFLKEEAIAQFNELNKVAKPGKEWTLKNLESGYEGFMYVYPPKDQQIILTHTDVIRLWGLTRAMLQVGRSAAASRL